MQQIQFPNVNIVSTAFPQLKPNMYQSHYAKQQQQQQNLNIDSQIFTPHSYVDIYDILPRF